MHENQSSVKPFFKLLPVKHSVKLHVFVHICVDQCKRGERCWRTSHSGTPSQIRRRGIALNGTLVKLLQLRRGVMLQRMFRYPEFSAVYIASGAADDIQNVASAIVNFVPVPSTAFWEAGSVVV
jgi:hypothetical protein